MFIAFGAKRHSYELDRHGNMVDRKYVDCKFVMDERTVDGHYYAQFLQAIRYSFQHPEVVEALPPESLTISIDKIYMKIPGRKSGNFSWRWRDSNL